MESRAPTRPTLAPKEHGAYGQIATPIVAALISGSPTVASGLLAVSAAALFVAHEPALVALGLRGTRAKREVGRLAQGRLLRLSLLALFAGVAGLALAPAGTARAALLPLAGALILSALVVRGAERSLPGEVVAALALSSAALPVAVAAGHSDARAGALVACFGLGFVAATFAVRSVLPRAPRHLRAASFGLAALVAGIPWILSSPDLRPAVPMAIAAALVTLWAPSPKHLRKVGFSLVGASLVTTGWLVLLG